MAIEAADICRVYRCPPGLVSWRLFCCSAHITPSRTGPSSWLNNHRHIKISKYRHYKGFIWVYHLRELTNLSHHRYHVLWYSANKWTTSAMLCSELFCSTTSRSLRFICLPLAWQVAASERTLLIEKAVLTHMFHQATTCGAKRSRIWLQCLNTDCCVKSWYTSLHLWIKKTGHGMYPDESNLKPQWDSTGQRINGYFNGNVPGS